MLDEQGTYHQPWLGTRNGKQPVLKGKCKWEKDGETLMKHPIGQKSASHEFTIWFHAAVTLEIVTSRRIRMDAA
jgi:hypothetical protein